MNQCKICGNAAGNREHVAREMMFGLREPFRYLECGGCGCLQLLDIPQDMARYYPPNYYSFQRHGRVMTALRHRWAAYSFGRFSPIGWLLSELVMRNTPMRAVRRLNFPKSSRILDVGCGAGHLLQDLKYLGFEHVTGVDPYLERDIVYEGGPTVYKRELAGMAGEFDVIMLHHCFEHMAEPGERLREVSRLLAPQGRVILRIPVASSYGWRQYGVNWVHLDAPRHLYLHTHRSIELLSEQAGLKVAEVVHEADEGTFWASEAYARDIPLSDPRFPLSTPWKKILNRRTTLEYRAKAEEINRRREADMVCYHLEKS